MHASVKQAIIGTNNGLAPNMREAINWTKDGVWLIVSLRTKFKEILIKMRNIVLKQMRL